MFNLEIYLMAFLLYTLAGKSKNVQKYFSII